ncbi:MAG TPA: S-layer homology domain-containing protein, partial [Thermoleophilia bacterium]|nr:S-layer homology domain-containing protein [Thermoleophilia bacterium]
TRPSNATVTLANGATISPTTPTGYAGLGIQCEVCHGTGSTANSHMGTGVGVVKFPRILTAEVCGQCHASGTTVETRLGGTSSFSNANGYTTDEVLADYITPYTPANEPTRFYPDGHNKGMNHTYYNEWLLTGHAESRSVLKDEAGDPLPFASEECMRCHSTEGYLKANGYQSSGLTGYTPSPATDETDIECALCHTVHDKTNPSGALGLRVEETEVCSQCHNAEIEEGATIVAGEAVHHPQKEMLEGYGLIGVADMGPSMGSATCVDCHMPETRAGRLSHVFTPMLPGNAEAWGVPELGDSCTPCHESTTRSTLQGNIDGWQAEVDALIANIDAVIAAAPLAGSSIPEFNGAVIDAAVANAEYVTADASGGVHNIRYARAGLTKALYYARAAGSTIDLTGPATADAGSLISLTGTLEFGDGGVGAAQTIKIMKKAAGSDTAVKVATVVTNGSGVFTAQIHPGSSGEYTAVWTPLEGADLTSDVHALTTSVGAALFADVPSTHIFFNYIQGLAKFGVVQGFSPGIFGPDAPVLRAQAAKMLVNALGFGSTTWTNWGHPTFVDVPQPAAQTEANRFPFDFVEKAYVNDIVKGVTATTFVPYGNITRWQLALMIARAGGSHLPPMTGSVMPFTDLAGVSNEVQSAILLCHDYGILDGTSATTFDPWSSATRGQAAKMIWNLAMLTGDLQ